MANTYNDFARLWHCATDDILSLKKHTEANSGLMPLWVRKVVLRPAATADNCLFTTLNLSSVPSCTVSNVQIDITSTATFTDALSGGCFNGSAVGDWIHVTTSTTGDNLGWYYLKTYTNTNVIVVENGTNALTNETGGYFNMTIYTPETCMVLVSMTSGTGAEVVSEPLDWGDKGRWFANLGMKSISGGTVDIYLR